MPTCEDHLIGLGAVASLEEKLRLLYGKRFALCVSSATTGLLGIALALNLKESEFLCTPYTYGGTIAPWLLFGNRPIFSDIDPMTLGLDPTAARRIATGRVKAILSADIYGIPADSEGLRALAHELGVPYIADAAQSFGASRGGYSASSCADALVVSFSPHKPISAGEGGAVLTDDQSLYEKLIWYTQHPLRQRRELGLRCQNEFALNGRIHPETAAWLDANIETCLKRLERRQQACFALIEQINDSGATEPICFRELNLAPSFSSLTAAWKRGPSPRKLPGISIRPAPVRLIYRQSAFLDQFGSGLRPLLQCTVAERQEKTRFCMSEATLEASSCRHSRS